MLRNGEIDILTATKITPERQKEFAFTTHPAITATTCLNVKAGNSRVIPGVYSTYEGLRVGLLRRHTYNGSFEDFAKEKGFSCEIVYYDTPTELTNALIHDEVDALVNSYIRTPEDERVVENFGQTLYGYADAGHGWRGSNQNHPQEPPQRPQYPNLCYDSQHLYQ